MLYNYQPQYSDELALLENEVVEVLSEHSTGWYFARSNARMGLVPANYLQEYDEVFNNILKNTTINKYK